LNHFLTEKLLFDTRHGTDCTLEVCTAGDPDADQLICSGSVSACLRKTMTHELAMTGDEYFSLSTRQDNYCGLDFDELCYKMGHSPEQIREMLLEHPSLDTQIQSATSSVKHTPSHRSATVRQTKENETILGKG